MIDLVEFAAQRVTEPPALLEQYALSPGNYAVLTIHRAHNTEDREVFEQIIQGIRGVAMPVIFPIHPRTQELARAARVGCADNIIATTPLAYCETIALLKYARTLFTDSGGMQKEAFALRVPCVTLREETEWIETLEDGWNVLTGADATRIARAAIRPVPAKRGAPYGNGDSAKRIVDELIARSAAALGPRGELCAS
jgi:UDP-N-acetylglucosamine 2-epimerase